MEKYYYTKWVKSSEAVPFEELIMLNVDLALWEKLTFLIRPYENESDVTDDNIEICATEALVSSEIDQITNAVNMFHEGHELVIRNNLRINHVNANRSWCINLIETFGANNLYIDKSAEQYGQLFVDFASIIDKLIAGAPELAYIEMLQLVPNASFSQVEKDEFIKRFEAKIGKALSDAIKASMGI